jgi:hypothetical protein
MRKVTVTITNKPANLRAFVDGVSAQIMEANDDKNGKTTDKQSKA